VRTDT